jgi:PHD/YefM family antitoxin component YafN of YafNO toxin-antitoxin module
VDRAEADDLDDLIRQESALKPDVRRIGNGEHVAILRHNGERFHLWSRDDWERHKSNWTMYLYQLEQLTIKPARPVKKEP